MIWLLLLLATATAVPERLAFSPAEVARMLGCSPKTVTRMVREGKLAKVDVGGIRRTMIPRWSVEKAIAECTPPGFGAVES